MDTSEYKKYSCLICTSIVSTESITKLDKLDTLFLLRILLEIPQDCQLFKDLNNRLNCIRICDSCYSKIKHCKRIYDEICEKIETFWTYQNNLLEKFPKYLSSSRTKNDNSDDWIFQCRKFVNDHDFTGFGFPFAVHDLETLLISNPTAPYQLKDEVNSNCLAKNEVPENNHSGQLPEVRLKEEPALYSQYSTQNENLAVKQEPESEDETLKNNQNEDYSINSGDDDPLSPEGDNDYEPTSHKKVKLSPAKVNSSKNCVNLVNNESPQIKTCSNRNYLNVSVHYPNFKRDPNTRKFHCTWSEDCSEQFVDKQYLQYHWDRHRGTPNQKCEECSQSFYSHNILARHRQVDHPKDGDKFDCTKCGKKCLYKEALLRHQKKCHGENEEEIMERIRKKKEDPIKRDPVTTKWMCYWPDCGKMYLERSDLNYHVDRHKGTPQQKCEECGELFFSKNQLNRHVQKEHDKEKKYECDICGKNFNASEDLRHHKSYKHSENGCGTEVVCEICGKTYKKGSIKNHMKYVHGSGERGVVERKFACHLCPSRFKDELGMKRHLWWMHQFCEREEDKERFEKFKKRAKERQYNLKCHVKGCRTKFATEEGLKKHVDGVHQGKWDVNEDTNCKFKCEVCGKGFHVEQKFTRHAKQHDKG